jgi:dihydrolipoamide dehydrogenase
VINSDHALYLDELPERAVILGSGAVGMEFATAWNAFGVDVTIVELEDRLLPWRIATCPARWNASSSGAASP